MCIAACLPPVGLSALNSRPSTLNYMFASSALASARLPSAAFRSEALGVCGQWKTRLKMLLEYVVQHVFGGFAKFKQLRSFFARETLA